MLIDFFKRELLGLRQDFKVWQSRMAHRRRAFLDLLTGRMTLERGEAVTTVRQIGVLLIICAILYGVGQFMPIGFDWKCCFSTGQIPPLHVPWVAPTVRLLNPALIFVLTVLGIGLRVRKYRGSVWIMALALISLPTLWVLFLGNLDGLVVFGLAILPISVPLVLLKPQLAAFALLANRRWIVAGLVWAVISILIWGLWPLNLLSFGFGGQEWKAGWPQDITLFPWGVLIALPLLWLSRGDEDMLMAAGSFGTPHLFPYHFIVLMPALARMDRGWAILSWLLAWTPLLANYLGPAAWHFGNLTSVSLWLGLYFARRAAARHPLRQLETSSYEPTA